MVYFQNNVNFVIGRFFLLQISVFYSFFYQFQSGRVEREIIEDMKKLPATTTTTTATATSTINRRHSMNTMPMSMRSFGRSNTAPLPDDGSPNKFQSSFNDDKSNCFVMNL